MLPVPYGQEKILGEGWPAWRLTEDDIRLRFGAELHSVGVLLGEPSGGIADVDLDHTLAVKLASEFLPTTSAVFGHANSRRSHFIYRVTGPIAPAKFRLNDHGTIVEIRSTGQQTIPPSVNPSGEPIAWEDESAEPAEVDPKVLQRAVKALFEAVAAKLERKRKKRPAAEASGTPSWNGRDLEAMCLKAMLRLGVRDQHDGSHRLFTSACRAVEFGLNDEAAVTVIRAYADVRPFPMAYSDDAILKRLRDAERLCKRGSALQVGADDRIPEGGLDPASGRIVLSAKRTKPTVEAFLREHHAHPDRPTVVHYAGSFYEWRNGVYVEAEGNDLKRRLLGWLHDALIQAKGELVPLDANPKSTMTGLETLRMLLNQLSAQKPPAWLNAPAETVDPREILPCRTCLLHVPTGGKLRQTPNYFSMHRLDIDPDPEAPKPERWHWFLDQLFGDDGASRRLLQDWFGYLLTGDTSLQKMLLIVGPRRSGKGTIARVLLALVGMPYVAGPTMADLVRPFGLQSLIGKQLAVVSDARFSKCSTTLVERLLCISGEDALTMDRKFKEAVTERLATRFLILSNELLSFSDASGVLAGRFLQIHFKDDFYGRENKKLTAELLQELPSIFNWALAGLRRLQERGRFSPAGQHARSPRTAPRTVVAGDGVRQGPLQGGQRLPGVR